MPPKKISNPILKQELDDEEMNVSSCCDCTGMIPAAPQNDEEAENYGDFNTNLKGKRS
ncbi:MAG: hypothetical protein LBS74_10510 [Oscillospiraceae bacterium]|jgi:hypothetical protein|nr:hypothetical protein [Oscillospiraceae bacterium]